MASTTILKCSFCGRPQNEVKTLISPNQDDSVSVCICNKCVVTAFDSLKKGIKPEPLAPVEEALVRPHGIKAHLDNYVVGQDHAKTDMSVAIYNHMKRRKAKKEKLHTDVEIEKANILLLGPSGTGKTLLARTIARMLKVPFFAGDATRLTQAGYVGDDVETLLQGLVQDAGGDLERAEWGIIYIDEIDKIARTSGRERTGYRDVSGEGVQQALLKLIEGSRVSIPRKGGQNIGMLTQTDTLDTSNILFICAGSFAGIESQVRSRLNKGAAVGFGASGRQKFSDEEIYRQVNEHDILDFGIIPELKGRLPVMTSTYALTEDQMVQILSEPKNSIIQQVQALFAMDDVVLQFEPAALRAIAQEAMKQPTGARALRSIVERSIAGLAFDVPADPEIDTVVVTEGAVLGTGKPLISRVSLSGEPKEEEKVA